MTKHKDFLVLRAHIRYYKRKYHELELNPETWGLSRLFRRRMLNFYLTLREARKSKQQP